MKKMAVAVFIFLAVGSLFFITGQSILAYAGAGEQENISAKLDEIIQTQKALLEDLRLVKEDLAGIKNQTNKL